MLLRADSRVGNVEVVSFLWMQADDMPPQKFSNPLLHRRTWLSW
jgi:hypothetical protein